MADRNRKSERSAKRKKAMQSGACGGTRALGKVVRILGIARSPSGERLGIAIQSRANPERLHILDMRLTAPQNAAGLIEWALKSELDALLDMGLKTLGPTVREAAAGKEIVVVDLPGYHRIMAGDVPLAAYAVGGVVYFLGRTPDFKVRVTGSAAQAVPSAGSWEAWMEAVQPIAKLNPRLLACLCVSLSAALLRAFGMPSFTLALWAPTTKGKSTIQLVCSSTTGPPKVLQWNGTRIGVQEALADSPDQPVCFDDMHKADRFEDIAQLVMATGNGSGRLVSKRSAGSTAPREIHTSPILSTEKALASMAGGSAAAGMFARFAEIGEGRYGMFDDLCGHDSGAALSDHLKAVVNAQYGTIWPRWLTLVSKAWAKVAALHKKQPFALREAILTAAAVSDAELDDVTRRVVANLVFAAFAGVVARKVGLWEISDRRISDAFGLLLREHLDRTPTGNALTSRIVEYLAGYIEIHRDKFPPTSVAKDSDRSGHVGYLIDDDKHGALYLFIPAVFRSQFVDEFGEEVYDALRAAGHLVSHGSRHNRFTKRIPTGRGGEKKAMDFIAIKASIRYAPTPK